MKYLYINFTCIYVRVLEPFIQRLTPLFISEFFSLLPGCLLQLIKSRPQNLAFYIISKNQIL